MNESTENRASEALEKRRRDVILTLSAASKMLPLVQHIVEEIVVSQSRLAVMQCEKERLDRHRRDLSWPERERRYHLDEEITLREKDLRAAVGELGSLGVELVDPVSGHVGFPTLVNKRRAYFSWLPGESALQHWVYSDESERRPIPANWAKSDTRKKSKG
jgi:hypothetical protein